MGLTGGDASHAGVVLCTGGEVGTFAGVSLPMDTFRPGMKSLSLISVVVLFSCLTCAVSSDVHVEGNPSEGVNVSTLKLVIEVCRHGDRSTLSTFPKDPLPYWNWPQVGWNVVVSCVFLRKKDVCLFGFPLSSF